jgi:hypothetical protein
MSASVLVVGDREHLTGLIRALNSVPEAGYRVVAASCGDAEHGYIGTVPVLGGRVRGSRGHTTDRRQHRGL